MEIDELFGRRALGVDLPEDYLQWATDCLAVGSRSENIAILAGLDATADSEEVHKCFTKACRDLGVELPGREVALRRYAKWLCEELAGGRGDPATILLLLARVSSASDCLERVYEIWQWLDEDLSQLECGERAVFNSGFTLENADDYIRKVAVQFLRLLTMELPKGFLNLTWCSACGEIEPEAGGVCVHCGSPGIRDMCDYQARRVFLDDVPLAVGIRLAAG